MKRVFSFSSKFLLAAGVLLFQAACGGGEPAAPPAAPASEAPAASAPPAAPVDRSQMELLEARQSATQTTITLVGRVKNISTRQVSGVSVSVNFQDANGNSVRVEQTSLATDPLPPDATSEFRVTTPYSEGIRRFSVSFAELFGGPLIMKDSRTQ